MVLESRRAQDLVARRASEGANAVSWFASYRLRRWLTVAALLSAINPALAQMRSRQIMEPQALRLQIIESYTGVFFEGVHEKTDYSGTSGATAYDRIFIAPLIGLNMAGSVYHPSLLTFTINGEAAPGYSHEKTTSSGATSELNEYRVLGNYLVNGTFLGSKPYRTILFLNQTYSYRDYDFFNRVEADILRYGATTGYREGPVPFTINVWRRHEDTFGLSDDSSLRETGLILDANNERASGSSAFNYTFTDYNRRDFGAEAGGTDHSFGVNDTEFFGRRKQIQLNTTLGYSTRQYTESPSDDFNASMNLSIEHRPTLSSFYDASYYHSSSDSTVGSVDSDNLNGGMSLRHQLYESLTSTIRLQGLDFSSSGSFTDTNGVSNESSSDTLRFGGGLTEQYTKHLNPEARLMVLGSVLYEHTDQQNSGGEIIQVDEAHSFPGSGSTSPSDTFFLNLPYVDETSIVITDGQNTLPAYQEGIDYTVSRNGFLTLIQRTGTSTIPRDAVVLVDYRAESSPSGNYDTMTSLLQVRVDFWNGLLGVYGRLNSVQNSGSSELFVQDISAVAFGADTIWRWLHAGAEYEIYDSTFSDYRTVRTYQSLAFKPDDVSTLNFDFIESYTQYLDADRDEQNYTFISRYRRRVTRHLGVNVEGGVSQRIGEGVDQTLAAFRPGLEFRMGEMSVKAGYDFEYGKFLNSEERFKHMLFVRARRSF